MRMNDRARFDHNMTTHYRIRRYDDALLDAKTLEVIAVGPLYQDEGGAIGIDVPAGRECTLTL